MTMGHRIAVMNEGELQQVATPENLYARPANAFVAHFLGSPGMNLIEGVLTGGGDGGGSSVEFAGASVPLPAEVAASLRTAGVAAGTDLVLGIRPEALRLSADGPINATVLIVELLGAETHVICHTESGARVIVRQGASSTRPALGAPVRVEADGDPASYHLFDVTTGARLGSA
jgi:multiple sugar transport system ATP-binding protein